MVQFMIDLQSAGSTVSSEPHLIANAVNGLRDALQLEDADWISLLARAELTLDDLQEGDAHISLRKGLMAFEAAAELANNPTLCIEYACAMPVGEIGPMGFAMSSARTVGDALRTIQRFLPLIGSLTRCEFVTDDEGSGIGWDHAVPADHPTAQLSIWGAASVFERLRPALEADAHPCRMEFNFSAPGPEEAFQRYFGPGLKFDAAQNLLLIASQDLDRRMPSSDDRLHHLMRRFAELEEARLGVHGTTLIADVRHAIAASLRDGTPSIDDIARQTGTTTAQLRRELKKQDLDFRRLVEAVRKAKAIDYLTGSQINITDIAFVLGYSETSAFTRACKNWFGKSPRAVRTEGL